jgi:hypothetical protein
MQYGHSGGAGVDKIDMRRLLFQGRQLLYQMNADKDEPGIVKG